MEILVVLCHKNWKWFWFFYAMLLNHFLTVFLWVSYACTMFPILMKETGSVPGYFMESFKKLTNINLRSFSYKKQGNSTNKSI